MSEAWQAQTAHTRSRPGTAIKPDRHRVADADFAVSCYCVTYISAASFWGMFPAGTARRDNSGRFRLRQMREMHAGIIVARRRGARRPWRCVYEYIWPTSRRAFRKPRWQKVKAAQTLELALGIDHILRGSMEPTCSDYSRQNIEAMLSAWGCGIKDADDHVFHACAGSINTVCDSLQRVQVC